MGAVQSILDSAMSNPSVQDAINTKGVESHTTSWVSNKLHRDMSTKFTELELLSLRQVFQQLQKSQDNLEKTKSTTLSEGVEGGEAGQQGQANSKENSPRLPGITESTFVEYLGFPLEKHRAGQLLFRSFFNLSVYPDNPYAIANPDLPRYLAVKDLIKPMALYSHKVNANTLLDVKPLKVIFESFAEKSSPLDVSPETTSRHVDDINTTSTTDIEPPIQDLSLKRTKTMEDSLKDLTSGANFEWNPEDDVDFENGPGVKAMDLVDILDGILWLIQQIVIHRNNADTTHPINISDSSLRHKASAIVEQIVQYGRTPSNLNTPIDLSSETISFGLFSKYHSRNCPNMFEILSQYFYNLFLVGNTLNPNVSITSNKFVMPGASCIPEMNAPSSIITPENLALLSWFLPLQKTTPSLTKLYIGSQNGFSMNQFEVHVCKYPAPTLLLLLVERQAPIPSKVNRRQSISFNNTTLRHRHSVSSNSPTYSTWSESRKSFDKLTGRSPTSPVSASGQLGTIFDDNPKSNVESEEPNEIQNSPPKVQNELSGNVPTNPTQKRVRKERLIIGAYVTETWRVSKSGWGNDTFALFELSPCFEVFPARKSASTAPVGLSSRSVPINGRGKVSSSSSSSRATGDQQLRHYIHFLKNAGVGFGGQASESCMLYMDDNIQYGSYRQDYAGGNIYMNAGGSRQAGFEIDFEIVECEVWGLGGGEAKARQQKEWDFEQREANRRASVHIRGREDQQIDMDLLEMAGIIDPDRGHRHTRRQSAV